MAELTSPDAEPSREADFEPPAARPVLEPDFYRQLVEYSPDAVVLQGLDRTIEYASPEITALTGWSGDELVGRYSTDLWHPDDVDRSTAARGQMFDGSRGVDKIRFRGRWLCKDGSYRWVDVAARPVLDADGSPTHLAVMARDAEAAVRSEQEQALAYERYRLVLEGTSDIVALHSPDGTLEWISPALERQLGWTVEQRLSGDTVLVHPEDAHLLAEVRDHLRSGLDQETARVRMLRSDGSYRWMDSTARALRDEGGDVVAITTVTRDVHDTVLAERALRSSEATLKATLDSLLDPHVVLRAVADEMGKIIDFVFVEVNDAFVSQNQVERRAVLERELSQLLPDHLREEFVEAFRHVVESGEPLSLDNLLFDPENLGRSDAQRLDIRAMRIGDDKVACTWRDVTDRYLAVRQLARSEQRFRLAMSSAPEGIAVVDLDRRFLEVNPALCRMLGRSEDWLLAHGIADIVHPDDEDLDREMRELVVSGEAESVTREKRLVRADGSLVWVEHAVGVLLDEAGDPLSFVSQFDDITEAREARLELEFLAAHDDLTGLVTRGTLMRKLDAMVGGADNPGSRTGVLFIDVDGLKALNDNYGHAVGDQILIEAANRIANSVGQQDVVARIGGDEFVVALPKVGSGAIAENLAQHILRAFDAPVHAGGEDIFASVSIGTSIADPGESPERALWQADRALYRAKREGRARVATWSGQGGVWHDH